MNNKRNCWDFMKCGKGPGGSRVEDEGICPVAEESMADGLNGGENGGRICWIIAETCDNDKVQCSDFHRKDSCFSCEFRYKVMNEEGLLNICKTTGHFLENSSLK